MSTRKPAKRGSHDVKELIPELFYLSEMFKNENNYDLGTMSENGHQVDDVVLPNWAKVSPFTSILSPFHFKFTLITHYFYPNSTLISPNNLPLHPNFTIITNVTPFFTLSYLHFYPILPSFHPHFIPILP